jgi:GNAT acetyltransferase-like protein
MGQVTTSVLTLRTSFGSVVVTDRVPTGDEAVWAAGLSGYAMDHRYYEIVHEALDSQFQHRYLVLKDHDGLTRALQPAFIVYQDLMTGTPNFVRRPVEIVRRQFPSFLKLRMLMVGSSAGEGDLARDICTGGIEWTAQALKEVLPLIAKRLRTTLIVFKDFPKMYRTTLNELRSAGFTRVPSMPATGLKLGFADFEEYLSTRLSHAMRKNLRRKFRKADSGAGIAVEAITDVTPFVEQLLPFYQAVFRRSKLRFEELNKTYLSELGRRMGDKARFLIWRLNGRIVAFASLLVHDGVLRDNYIGLDYSVALDYHLYFLTWRDTIVWAIRNGCHTYHSAPLNYDPKFHFRMHLEPLDLYVRATQDWLNPLFAKLLPLLEPTRYDRAIQKFANKAELW